MHLVCDVFMLNVPILQSPNRIIIMNSLISYIEIQISMPIIVII